MLHFADAEQYCHELGGHLPQPMTESELIYIDREWQVLIEAVPSLRNEDSNYYFLDAKKGARSTIYRHSNGFRSDLYNIDALKFSMRTFPKGCSAVKSYLGNLVVVDCKGLARVLCELKVRHQKR